MPYLLLFIGLLIGFFALYRFFIQATSAQIKAAFLSFFGLVIGLSLLYMSVTGRFIPALALFAALLPIFIQIRKTLREAKEENGKKQRHPHSSVMTEEEALEILGLQRGASDDAIRAAYKKLIQKVHPDHEGSEWMAAKLNEAKDFLLKKS